MSLRQSVIPTVLEQSARGERAFDIYSLLLRERIVFLGQEVDDQIANLIIAELLYLEAEDPERDISLYINSPGGLAYAGMAIYDVIQHIRPDVSTVCVGMGMSAAAMVLCGGAPGKRLALPSAKIMIHQGSAGTRGAPRDMEIQLREVLAITQAPGRGHRPSHRAPDGAGGEGSRPRLLHDRAGSQGLRPHRRHHRPPPRSRLPGTGGRRRVAPVTVGTGVTWSAPTRRAQRRWAWSVSGPCPSW